MNVVGHPDVGVNGETVPVSGLNQGIAEELIIRLGGKDGLSAVAAG